MENILDLTKNKNINNQENELSFKKVYYNGILNKEDINYNDNKVDFYNFVLNNPQLNEIILDIENYSDYEIAINLSELIKIKFTNQEENQMISVLQKVCDIKYELSKLADCFTIYNDTLDDILQYNLDIEDTLNSIAQIKDYVNASTSKYYSLLQEIFELFKDDRYIKYFIKQIEELNKIIYSAELKFNKFNRDQEWFIKQADSYILSLGGK